MEQNKLEAAKANFSDSAVVTGEAASTDTKSEKRIFKTILIICVILTMFAITTYAIFLSVVTIKDNYFHTLNRPEFVINDGKTIFDGANLNLEPGAKAKADFTVRCDCTYNVWCRIYLENISGELQDCTTFRIFQNGALLFESPATEFDQDSPFVLPFILTPDYRANFSIEVLMDESAGNTYQDKEMEFDIVAQVVQTKNNPDKDFTIYE